MTIYFDTCALNRLTDDQTQPRIRAEAVAVEQVLDAVNAGKARWLASNILRVELEGNPHEDERNVSLRLLAFASEFLHAQQSTEQRAAVLFAQGYGSLDALHLALAEEAHVEYLLTVDDRFLRRAHRLRGERLPHVVNPVDWLTRR